LPRAACAVVLTVRNDLFNDSHFAFFAAAASNSSSSSRIGSYALTEKGKLYSGRHLVRARASQLASGEAADLSTGKKSDEKYCKSTRAVAC
jgi:hypothetical protein